MSLNHLVNGLSNFKLPIYVKEITTDTLYIKLKDTEEYISFKLPNIGNDTQVLKSNGNGTFEWVDNDTNISTVFIIENSQDLVFENKIILSPYFELHRTGNFSLNNFIQKKVLINLNIIYMWLNNEIPPDFTLQLLVNDIIVYSNIEGLSDYPNKANKLNDQIMIDINKDDVIKFQLVKDGNDGAINYRIMKNSFYSIELL
jgi:hypothetical protein